MRIKTKKKKELVENETRQKTGFLLFPKKLEAEWRWLETATWEQRCMRLTNSLPVYGGCYSPGQTLLKWVSVRWVSDVGNMTENN